MNRGAPTVVAGKLFFGRAGYRCAAIREATREAFLQAIWVNAATFPRPINPGRRMEIASALRLASIDQRMEPERFNSELIPWKLICVSC